MLVFCNGMLRSGSAFQYNLVSSLLEKIGPCVRHGRWEPKDKITKSDLIAWAKDPKTYHVVKSARYPEEFELARDGLAKMCYINRDLRDIAVAAKYKWGLKRDGLLEMLDRAITGYETMERVQAFDKPWCLHQKYEEVYTNTSGAILEIARFLEVSPSPEMIDEIIKECSIERMTPVTKSKSLSFNHTMRDKLGNMAVALKKILPASMKGSWGLRSYYLKIFPKVDPHTCMAVRHIEPTKGVPGAWRSQLDKEEQKLITVRYKDYLRRAGYSVEGASGT